MDSLKDLAAGIIFLKNLDRVFPPLNLIIWLVGTAKIFKGCCLQVFCAQGATDSSVSVTEAYRSRNGSSSPRNYP